MFTYPLVGWLIFIHNHITWNIAIYPRAFRIHQRRVNFRTWPVAISCEPKFWHGGCKWSYCWRTAGQYWLHHRSMLYSILFSILLQSLLMNKSHIMSPTCAVRSPVFANNVQTAHSSKDSQPWYLPSICFRICLRWLTPRNMKYEIPKIPVFHHLGVDQITNRTIPNADKWSTCWTWEIFSVSGWL